MKKIFIISAILLLAAFLKAQENISLNKTTSSIENIVEGNNKFAFKFYSKISNAENIFFSPFSIYSAFAMTYEGSAGQTKKEFERVFNFPSEKVEIRDPFKLILSNFSKENPELAIKIANSIWVQKEYHFLSGYIELLKDNYFSEFFDSDFKSAPEKEREKINLWVKEKTLGKIDSLIPPNGLNSLTRLVLANAIYFKGLWENKFDKNLTFNDHFVNGKKNIPIKMMTYPSEVKLPYYKDQNLQMIELPYKGKEISMYIILPTAEDTKEIEKDLTYEKFKKWSQEMRNQKIKVFIPKLKLEYYSKLNEILTQMGLKTAFTEKANFTEMDNTRKLYIQKAFHKAKIEIDEEGSEASAATAVSVGIKAVMMTPIFKANKPFIFLIIDKRNNLILFMGKVSEPELQDGK